jgi:glycosyltransferase involved in cell wall biosynthesis
MEPGVDVRLVLFSSLAFYPVHWLAYEEILERYHASGVVIAPPAPALTSVHRALGTMEARAEGHEVHRMPGGHPLVRLAWLARTLARVRPDVLWVQEEPTNPYLLAILLWYRLRRRPRIVVSVCENVFPRPSLPRDGVRRLAWGRIDMLAAVATPSIEGVRRGGMPQDVPAVPLVAGSLGPPSHVEPARLAEPRRPGEFFVGFAGNLTEQKGWRVLVEAVTRLPPRFRLLVAGDGPDRAELEVVIKMPSLAGRVSYVGLLPKEQLWGFYAHLDCLVMPSVTVSWPREQFGGVLVDGMAMGLPLIGSSSSAIPEVIGPAGLVVPERDSAALAAAIDRLDREPDLRRALGEQGRARYQEQFAVDAYAGKLAALLELEPRSPLTGIPSPT